MVMHAAIAELLDNAVDEVSSIFDLFDYKYIL